MAVIKLNDKETMAKKKQRKPTNQDFINVINSLIVDINELQDENQKIKYDMGAVMQAVELYIEFKKDSKEFDNYCTQLAQEMTKENELQATEQDNPVADNADSSD